MASGGTSLGAALAAGLLLAIVGPAQSAPAPLTGPTASRPDDLLLYDRQVREATDRFLEAAPSSRCGARFERYLDEVVKPRFDRLPPDTRTVVLRVAAACEKRKRTDAGVALLRRLEPLARTPAELADVNEALMDDARIARRYDESARRLIVVIDHDPRRVVVWKSPYVAQILDKVSADRALSTALLSRMVSLPWTDAGDIAQANNDWALTYAELLVDAGDVAGAERALAKTNETATLMTVAQDRRFAPLWPRFEAAGRFDWRRATEAELALALGAGGDDSQGKNATLARPTDLQQLLRQLQRYDEAIVLGQRYQARIKAGRKIEDANWILNELGYALLDVGRVDQARAAFEQAIAVGENGGSSVSQKLNWAEMLNLLGQPREALAVVDSLDPDRVAAYGAMWADAERVCAASVLQPGVLPPQLASMRTREDDNPAALTRALLCLDRQDETAALYIRRLASPKHRADALKAFRKPLAAPVLTPRQIELERRRQAVIARPEVVKAMQAVGRPITIPLAAGYWGAL